MKTTTFIFLLFTTNLFGQTLSEKEIQKYVNTIDSLRNMRRLDTVENSTMSFCGGGLDGYYYKDKLVYIDSRYNAELGYSKKTLYLKDTVIYKVIYRQHFAEWGKYKMNYPADKYDWDPSKMTYTDTLYTITFSTPISFIKTAGEKIISKEIDKKLIDELLFCGREMRYELETIKTSR